MKIVLINGSPKHKHSASAALLQMLQNRLPVDWEIIHCHFNEPKISTEDWERIRGAQALVFSFPLYVDGIPSHLLHCLEQMETYSRYQNLLNEVLVYAIINCGFYEGHQNALALELMRNWCAKTGFRWGQGVGIGGGGMIPALTNVSDDQGPKKNVGKAIRTLADHIMANESASDLFTNPNFPRFAYKLIAEMSWRQLGKKNGLSSKDLSTQR